MSASPREKVAAALRRRALHEAAYQTVTVGELVEMRGRTHGSVVALDFFERGERATYAEVDASSSRYAHALRAFGVRKGDAIGVLLPNRLEFPLLWYAIAKLGAVMVPLNMRYTSREVEYVLSDSNAKFAIVDETAWSIVAGMEPWPRNLPRERILIVGDAGASGCRTLADISRGASDAPVQGDVHADDLLNIQYTSGTTGFPKGCMLTHDNRCLTSYIMACWEPEPYRRYLSASPIFYGDGQWHLLRTMRQGGTLYVAERLSSTRYIGWIKQHGIEWAHFPELVTRQPEAPDDAATALKQVTHFGWGRDSIQDFRRRFGARGMDGFGMTETGFSLLMPYDIEEMHDSGSVGIPAPFREVRIVNDDGTPTADGEVGELWVTGRSILQGYWNKPEANRELFEGEWFKTGDLFRRNEDGFHWLVGRKKDMIRRSNENIAAREVEAIFRAIPEIADVAAVPVRDPKRGEEVKLVVELKEGFEPRDLPVERILAHGREHLAVFKVPRYIAFMPALPRTASNKVLKRDLVAVSEPLAGCYDGEEERWR